MSNVIHPSVVAAEVYKLRQPSLFIQFINWSKNQQGNRLLWLSVALAGHGCVITPVTIYFIVFAGLSLPLFMIALFAMAFAVVVNLAALPTKITIPALVFSILVDISILLYLLAMAL